MTSASDDSDSAVRLLTKEEKELGLSPDFYKAIKAFLRDAKNVEAIRRYRAKNEGVWISVLQHETGQITTKLNSVEYGKRFAKIIPALPFEKAAAATRLQQEIFFVCVDRSGTIKFGHMELPWKRDIYVPRDEFGVDDLDLKLCYKCRLVSRQGNLVIKCCNRLYCSDDCRDADAQRHKDQDGCTAKDAKQSNA